MKVSLIDYTGHGHADPADHAANVLIFTKSTRLNMSPGLFDEISNWPHANKMDELEYMAGTIPSSWEFVQLTFLIENVTRGFTHQLVRTRTASFAQQTMRILHVDGWSYGVGPTIMNSEKLKTVYDETMDYIDESYNVLIENGAKIEDARGVLPTNIHTNIVMSCNLRTLVGLVSKRSSSRVQGEYREVLECLKDRVIEVYPWAELFLKADNINAANELQEHINDLDIDDVDKTNMIKLLDRVRTNGEV